MTPKGHFEINWPLKSPTFFTKFNSLGTINIVFLIGVVFYFASQWGINANMDDIHSEHYIPMFKKSFPSLSGMMALGFFIHNAILTILKKNRYQENNVRFKIKIKIIINNISQVIEFYFGESKLVRWLSKIEHTPRKWLIFVNGHIACQVLKMAKLDFQRQ